jgi:XTP/dITP diphosphohydrolase
MTSLLLATRNPHKTRELAALLGPEFLVGDLTALPQIPAIEETGKTFAENATLKALTVSRITTGLVVADDSGLEVDSLGGAPGVYSARYAGDGASDEANVVKLLRALHESEERAAQFRCVLVLARDGDVITLFDGIVRGEIAPSRAGTDGFGYDPIFVPDGFSQTFATLGESVKNQISHRARAAAQLRDYLLGNKKGGEDRRP